MGGRTLTGRGPTAHLDWFRESPLFARIRVVRARTFVPLGYLPFLFGRAPRHASTRCRQASALQPYISSTKASSLEFTSTTVQCEILARELPTV